MSAIDTVAALRLSLLDGFELTDGDAVLVLPLAAQRVIAFLGVHERPLLRGYVAAKLWPAGTDRTAGASLRSVLWRLGDAARVVAATRTHIALAPAVAVDVRAQMAAARAALADPAPAGGVPRELLRGDLLPDWYDDWVELERRRLRQIRLDALEAMAGGFVAASRFGDATEAALAVIRAEPYRDTAHATLVSAYLGEGNIGQAVLHYRAYSRALKSRFGVEPTWSVGLKREDGNGAAVVSVIDDDGMTA